jgi:hypothetical protein
MTGCGPAVSRSGPTGASDPVLTGSPAAAAVQIQHDTGWRVVQTIKYCGNGALMSVTADSARDAWAVGQPLACGANVQHWNGTSWSRVPVPAAIDRVTDGSSGPMAPVAASSAADAWIFPHPGSPPLPSEGWALHWTGSRWQKTVLPDQLAVATAAAFGPDDVWAFGGVQKGADAGVLYPPYAGWFDGRAWHIVKMPGQPLAVSALTRGDIWAVGPTLGTVAKPPARQVIVAMHWTGRSWHDTPVPRVAGSPIAAGFLAPAYLVADGPHDLWWAYPGPRSSRGAQIVVLHWHSGTWQRVAVPPAVTSIDGMAQDGHGGLWLCTLADTQQYCYHYSAGRWSRQLVPCPRGYGLQIYGLTLIPETTSLWAVGEADPNRSGAPIGVILRYSP